MTNQAQYVNNFVLAHNKEAHEIVLGMDYAYNEIEVDPKTSEIVSSEMKRDKIASFVMTEENAIKLYELLRDAVALE